MTALISTASSAARRRALRHSRGTKGIQVHSSPVTDLLFKAGACQLSPLRFSALKTDPLLFVEPLKPLTKKESRTLKDTTITCSKCSPSKIWKQCTPTNVITSFHSLSSSATQNWNLNKRRDSPGESNLQMNRNWTRVFSQNRTVVMVKKAETLKTHFKTREGAVVHLIFF